MRFLPLVFLCASLTGQVCAQPSVPDHPLAGPNERFEHDIGLPADLPSFAKGDSARTAASNFSKEHARPCAEWVKEAVIYEVYPRSFSKDESFLSVIKALPELKRLGVTVLWVMPIHPIGKLHRKGPLGSPYSIRDYYKINPEYGSLAGFRKLVEAVHAEGMHIIMDAVLNHTAWDNPLIKEHPDWYKHDSTGNIIPPNPDWTDVAQLNYANKNLRRYMIRMLEYWVKNVGVDGFRCDAAELVPVSFWDEAQTALDSIRPVMMLAEGAKPNFHLKAFDLTYSWGIYNVLGKIFRCQASATAVDSVLGHERCTYPAGALHLYFNTNHDENVYDAPSIDRYGPGGDSLTIALIATLPGIPLIYSGDEVGNRERLSLFEQVLINWSAKNGYRSLYEKVYSIRRANPELAQGTYKAVAAGSGESILAFERVLNGRRAICVFNFSKVPVEAVKVTVSGSGSQSFVDDVTERRYTNHNGSIELSIRKFGFLILTLQ